MLDNSVMQTALEELRISNEGALAAGDALDQKANFLFAGGSVIFGVIAALAIGPETIRTGGPCQVAALAISTAFYLAMMVVFVLVVAPRKYRTALKEDRDTIGQEVIARDSSEALLALVEGYIDTIDYNLEVNEKKALGVRWSAVLMAALVLGLIVLTLAPS